MDANELTTPRSEQWIEGLAVDIRRNHQLDWFRRHVTVFVRFAGTDHARAEVRHVPVTEYWRGATGLRLVNLSGVLQAMPELIGRRIASFGVALSGVTVKSQVIEPLTYYGECEWRFQVLV